MDVRKFIDNSLLKPNTTWKELRDFVRKSEEIGFYAVCIPPSAVRFAREVSEGRIVICSVIGFPLGYSNVEIKIHEAVRAIEDGAQELDIVLNLVDLKSGNWKKVEEEVKALIRHARSAGVLTKFIIETCYLTDKEKIRAVQLLEECGADFVKTSTGFGHSGATVEDVRLLKEHGKGIKVKASGGIRTYAEVVKMIEAGADRIGTSSGFEIYSEMMGG